MLIFFLAAAVFGLQYAWLMDPLPLLWRTFGAVIFPGLTYLINSSFDLLIATGLDADFLYDIFDYIALHIITLEAVAVQSALVVAIMFVVILGLSILSRRFWCRNLCPLGALLGLLSKVSLLMRSVDRDSCSECKVCSRGCKMGAINADFVSTEKSECIFCLNCGDTCAQSATSFIFGRTFETTSPVDLNRRGFIGASATGAVFALGTNLLDDPAHRDDYLIRPPGARPEGEFLDRCIRCNECVRICATTGKCLQPVIFEASFAAFWTPLADFNTGYCEYNCNLCGEICPTSAIEQLPLEIKKHRQMGLAVLNDNLCLPIAKKENCIVCEEHCPTPEKAIIMEEKRVINDAGESILLKIPSVSRELCIGCGICEIKCPVEPERAIRIINDIDPVRRVVPVAQASLPAKRYAI